MEEKVVAHCIIRHESFPLMRTRLTAMKRYMIVNVLRESKMTHDNRIKPDEVPQTRNYFFKRNATNIHSPERAKVFYVSMSYSLCKKNRTDLHKSEYRPPTELKLRDLTEGVQSV